MNWIRPPPPPPPPPTRKPEVGWGGGVGNLRESLRGRFLCGELAISDPRRNSPVGGVIYVQYVGSYTYIILSWHKINNTWNSKQMSSLIIRLIFILFPTANDSQVSASSFGRFQSTLNLVLLGENFSLRQFFVANSVANKLKMLLWRTSFYKLRKPVSKLIWGGMKEAEKAWLEKRKNMVVIFLFVLKYAIFFLGKKTIKIHTLCISASCSVSSARKFIFT